MRPSQHPSQPRRPKPPVFEGLPSPALRKMLRMSRTELQEYIDKLEQERASISARLARASAVRPADPKDERLELETRLGKLIDKAKLLLDQKIQSKPLSGPRPENP